MPYHMAKHYGGWTNRKLIDFFVRYATTVMTHYPEAALAAAPVAVPVDKTVEIFPWPQPKKS